jgi:hypothetical protein
LQQPQPSGSRRPSPVGQFEQHIGVTRLIERTPACKVKPSEVIADTSGTKFTDAVVNAVAGDPVAIQGNGVEDGVLTAHPH